MDVNGFLKEDKESAFKEIICITERDLEMRQDFSAGNYKSAKVAAEDIVRSFHVLDNLQKRKKSHDEMFEYLEELKAQESTPQGATAEILLWFIK